MRLITFGCSYTQGIGLDGLDYSAHLYYYSPLESVLKIQSASKDAWPHLLADKLGLECINLGRGGSSCKYVFQMIREFDFQKTDIVVVQWPDPSRNIIWNYDEERLIANNSQELTAQYVDYNNVEFYKKYYTEFNAVYDNVVLIENTHVYLKDKCDQVHSISNNLYSKSKIKSAEGLRFKRLIDYFPILSEVTPFFDDYILINDVCNDGHPGKKVHIAFAEDMFLKIDSKVY